MSNCPQTRVNNSVDMSAVGLVRTRFYDLTAYARDAYNTALSLLNMLSDIPNQFKQIDVSVPLGELNVPNIEGILAEIPDPPTIDTTVPPPISLDYNESPYVSDLFNSLKNKLLTELSGGGTGLGESVEQDMFNRETERDEQILADTKDRISAEWAERGFSLPDGVLANALVMADIEYMHKQLDKSRDIRIETRKYAIENMRHTIEQGNVFEKNSMDYQSEVNERLLKSATGILSAGVSLYDAYMKRFAAISDIYRAQAAIYEASVRGQASVADVHIALYKARGDYAISSAQIALKQIEMTIEQLRLKLGLASEAAKSAATVASHLAAGALSAVNASASIGYSASESDSSSNIAQNESSCSHIISESI